MVVSRQTAFTYLRSEAQRLFFALVLLVSGFLAVRFGDASLLRWTGAAGIALSAAFVIVILVRLARAHLDSHKWPAS